MKAAQTYTKNQIDKLGNALIFICERLNPIAPVFKTQLLKFIFIIEEISIKKFGVPFFDLRFNVWKLGPVSKDLYVELTDEPNFLANFIERRINDGGVHIFPKQAFSDDEFSDDEITLMEEVVERFKYCTAKELINLTHRKNTPWYNAAQKNGVLELLESGKLNTTDFEIDLSELLEEDEEKLAFYKDHKEFIKHAQSLKS